MGFVVRLLTLSWLCLVIQTITGFGQIVACINRENQSRSSRLVWPSTDWKAGAMYAHLTLPKRRFNLGENTCVLVWQTPLISSLFPWSMGVIVPVWLPPLQRTPDVRKSADSSTEGGTTRACKQSTHQEIHSHPYLKLDKFATPATEEKSHSNTVLITLPTPPTPRPHPTSLFFLRTSCEDVMSVQHPWVI